jgi:hypothetical protein
MLRPDLFGLKRFGELNKPGIFFRIPVVMAQAKGEVFFDQE